MGWLITGLGTLITSIIAFFGRKMVTVTGAISSFVLLTAALVVCIKALLTQVLTLAVIPTWIATAVGLFIPADFALVMSMILGARSCRFAYDLAKEKIGIISSAN